MIYLKVFAFNSKDYINLSEKVKKICYEFGYILKITENNSITKAGTTMVSSHTQLVLHAHCAPTIMDVTTNYAANHQVCF